VFNDGAFGAITKKDARDDMLIDLIHGEPIRFGTEGERGVARREGGVQIVDLADVGEDAILVHDELLTDPSTAFSLSRLAEGPHTPTPIGVFRACKRDEYGRAVADQIANVTASRGKGDLSALLRSLPTWEV
jgi:2-oxoglutarate ferredoxin oxidoreductase subunit beta